MKVMDAYGKKIIKPSIKAASVQWNDSFLPSIPEKSVGQLIIERVIANSDDQFVNRWVLIIASYA